RAARRRRGGLGARIENGQARAAQGVLPNADRPGRPLGGQGMTDSRRLALTVIAVLVAVFALHWGRTFFVSLFMGILIAYALNPVVVRMERLRMPRWAGAALVVCALCAASVLAAGMLGGEVRAVAEQLPEAARKVSAKLSSMRDGGPGTLEKVQAAAREIEKATNQATGTPPPSKQPPPRSSSRRVSRWVIS